MCHGARYITHFYFGDDNQFGGFACLKSSEREHIAADSCPQVEEKRHKNTLLFSLSVIHKLTFCYKSLVFVDRKSNCFFFYIFVIKHCKDSAVENQTRLSIRIYHKCEGRIEKSILRIAVWHHET